MSSWSSWRLPALLIFCSAFVAACSKQPRAGTVLDEAQRAGRTLETFLPADEDYFREMDRDRNGVVVLKPEEIAGRNTWLVWTGGNDRFWDAIGTASGGALDFLKTLSSCPPQPGAKCHVPVSRDDRWKLLGLVNEPCFRRASKPDAWGLWLDERKPGCKPDPFENADKYPGVSLCALARTCDGPKDRAGLPADGSFYGHASGIVGLRLFPNPAFDAEAKKRWDPQRFYSDPSYYFAKDLVRPYRVGMSCAFCHVGPNPINPPPDPENPKWEHLSSNVGAQYFWVDRIFAWEGDRTSYAFQMFHTSRPGALDTSLVSTDNINNPRTMNAVYDLGPRLGQALKWGREELALRDRKTLYGGSADNKQFNDFTQSADFTRYFQAGGVDQHPVSWSPRVLKDGADSVGALGALNRVYLNIGLFSEEWLLHFNPLIGGKPTTPIRIADARKNSTYWQATEQQTLNLAKFFLRTTAPHRLADAPGGDAYLNHTPEQLHRGKVVFAERCARCHSSKLPAFARLDEGGGCSGENYLQCWNEYWARSKTEEFRAQMRGIVLREDFLEGNYLSSELRIPVSLLQTNACSPLASNAIRDNIWDNFSSDTYKSLSRVNEITIHDPLTGSASAYQPAGGGRGYTRPASLISLWSTAPYLLNNTVGALAPKGYGYEKPCPENSAGYSCNPVPTVEKRLEAFDDGIRKLLSPELRDHDTLIDEHFLVHAAEGADGRRLPGLIDRTSEPSYLRVPAGYLPGRIRFLQGFTAALAPWLFGEGGVEIGPIPTGTPINLIANLDLVGDTGERKDLKAAVRLLWNLKKGLKRAHETVPENLAKEQPDEYAKQLDEATREELRKFVPDLLKFNKCPDFIVNRGHYFGTGFLGEKGEDGRIHYEPALSDEDKEALIAFLKTF